MKAHTLARKLLKQPNWEIGIAHHDNTAFEVAMWVRSVTSNVKSDFDENEIPMEDRQCFRDMPERWIALR